MASSHAEIFLLSEEGLVAELEAAINANIVPKVVEYNFQPNKILPCRIRIEKIQYDRRRILKEILVAMINNVNTMVKAGKYPSIVPSLKEMSDILGVPLTTFEEEYMDVENVDGEPDVPGEPGAEDNTNTPMKKQTKDEKVVNIKRQPVKKQPNKEVV